MEVPCFSTNGSRQKPPIKNLIPLKVYVPMLSPATDWATNAAPQTTDARSRSSELFICLELIDLVFMKMISLFS